MKLRRDSKAGVLIVEPDDHERLIITVDVEDDETCEALPAEPPPKPKITFGTPSTTWKFYWRSHARIESQDGGFV